MFDAFTEFHNDLKKIGIKNVLLRKKNVKLSNENKSLNVKLTCLELENNKLYDELVSSNGSIIF